METQPNIIAFNNGPGVQVGSTDFETTTTNFAILGNLFFGNVGLAIDLGHAERNTNDVNDADTGPNNLQNFPVPTTAVPAPGTLTVSGTLNSASNTTYRIEIFHSPDFDPTNQPQAKTFLGVTNATTDASGDANFSVTFNQTISGGFITATATDPARNTSEISDGLPFAKLEIARIGAQVRVLWLTNLASFVLQSNATLGQSAGWSNVPGTPQVAGEQFFFDFTANAARLFRLRSP